MQETVRNCPVCFVSLSYVADVRLSQITKDLDILQSKKHILIYITVVFNVATTHFDWPGLHPEPRTA